MDRMKCLRCDSLQIPVMDVAPQRIRTSFGDQVMRNAANAAALMPEAELIRCSDVVSFLWDRASF
jgi:hypothetical protein